MRRLLLAGALLASAAHSACAADWKMDAGASRLEFAVTFEKTAAPGVFKEFDTHLRFDADRPGDGRLDVTIVVKSADMNSGDINKAIGGAEWFDYTRFPRAEFHATEIRRVDANRYVARGTLTLKGLQQSIDVPFAWSEAPDISRMTGEFTVKRAAFGIGTGEWAATNVIGADVEIKFDIRLRKGG